MQNWKFSHFQKQGNVRKIESYYIHLNNIDRHLKLVAACKKKKQLEIFFFFNSKVLFLLGDLKNRNMKNSKS